MEIARELSAHARHPFTHQWLGSLLKKYKFPNDKVHDLIQQQLLEPVKRGLYVAGPALKTGKPEPFLLANHIMGPSYVSVDTALFYYGLIPERVYEIASMTIKSSREFSTPFGHFSYTRLPLPYYAFGIRQIKLAEDQFVLAASPEKALCDRLITTSGLVFRSQKAAKAWLLEDLRMEEEQLRQLDTKAMLGWLKDAPKNESLKNMIKVIENV
ncbi:type IV toxin-antitoxin system AbiEi family antitoxin domain-containing protein [Dinghuibacter silviterrae]|uniref:Transcriptional regulator, AbiEi antitoxin, Type IV TA system n=1 Tax=Dinghuibacter silviterrae TaxID=1539049 RepID=A0A4R8DS84_9BACT|nr:hypothetical protein [Dinghuibacter silviterrae]TDX01114.1 hypothetical protein EDB95_2145 [Dinghuibacter silviterrae]